MNDTDNDKLLTAEELGEKLQLSIDYIRLMAREGEIPSIKLKREWRFDYQEVKDALRARGIQ